jgi:hypothetical protein
VPERTREGRRRLSVELSSERIDHLDALKREWGLRNRGDVLERLFETLFPDSEDEGDGKGEGDGATTAPESLATDESDLDEQGALVLVERGDLETLSASFEPAGGGETQSRGAARGGGGIDLPGFVRRRSNELRRSLESRPAEGPPVAAPFPRLGEETAQLALEAARNHWIGLYGTEANEAVLEAAMTWLAHDIWPQAEPVEGRPFTWSAACTLMHELVESWGEEPVQFERVIVTAGVIEDPFSAGSLVLRIPSLIHRFVQRFRRRRRGTSFQTLEQTMTLQGALKLLGIPAELGRRVTLAQIRESYREMAQRTHPDAGGSHEGMRRLNEAYQLLKELYRQPEGRDQGTQLN